MEGNIIALLLYFYSMDNYNTDYKKSKDKNTYNNIKQKADNKKI